MEGMFLFIAGILFFTFFIGRFIERWRIPWIMGALFLGAAASFFEFFDAFHQDGIFLFLSKMGMFFLLFIIGFEIDLKEMKKKSYFLFRATFLIIGLEAIVSSFFFHFALGYSWFVSLLVGFSFATVGEVILIPILSEFRIVNSSLGRSIIGIGILDDIIEIILLLIVVDFVGLGASSYKIFLAILLPVFLVVLSFWMNKLGREESFSFQHIEKIFLFLMFVLFFFIGLGDIVGAGPVAAFLAGISVKTFIPKKRLALVEKETKSVAYGIFAPIFFFHIGAIIDFAELFKSPLILAILVVLPALVKIFGSLVVARKEMGFKERILLGVGLSARFSTSIIIIKILLDAGLIDAKLYSLVIASGVILTIAVPIIFSRLLVKWKMKN